jgi:REP element-mobilizing transposase RayT
MVAPKENLPKRKTVRLASFDYRTPTGYFITLCARNRQSIFGKFESGNIILSPLGELVRSIWHSLDRHHHVVLDEFIVMPNHIHGIIFLLPQEVDAARCVRLS